MKQERIPYEPDPKAATIRTDSVGWYIELLGTATLVELAILAHMLKLEVDCFSYCGERPILRPIAPGLVAPSQKEVEEVIKNGIPGRGFTRIGAQLHSLKTPVKTDDLGV